MKRILLFGSTGSIGRNVLDLVQSHPNKFEVALLSCRRNARLLVEQALQFNVGAVHLQDESQLDYVRESLPATTSLFVGSGRYARLLAEVPADLVVNAIVGAAGLELSYYSLKAGLNLALANKESLVAGGELLTMVKRQSGGEIIPIDSEHSAIWQCLRAGKHAEVEKIILTASGGPFRNRDKKSLASVTIAEALNHPNWSMGKKITIDSATMMNKGLEVIEAHFLFGLPPEQIDIVVHPESIIHSLVQFVDGAQIAQLSPPDMRLPIAFALSYPDRLTTTLPRTNLAQLGKLTFSAPDSGTFPCISLAYDALRMGGTAPLVLNAANEIAVESFLAERIRFSDIATVVEKMLTRTWPAAELSLEVLQRIDRQVRIDTEELIRAQTVT
ncbi:MAG: 1-deoxy-D-xylulose-5-phosphate reductoisomerase [candidate division Zixibacteria bacterium]|nr:1-deoxy-D-xylulose-5-phosphate reductoisomerase [candidate division Zixibacteria bacterium]